MTQQSRARGTVVQNGELDEMRGRVIETRRIRLHDVYFVREKIFSCAIYVKKFSSGEVFEWRSGSSD